MSVKLESFGVSPSFESDRIGWKMIKHVRSKQWTILILGLWVGLQGLKFGCCYTSQHPSMFFCVFDRELARRQQEYLANQDSTKIETESCHRAIRIESDRRSHRSDIEVKYGDQKPNLE